MSAQDDSLPAHWQYYFDRSQEADAGRADDLGSGREEQLGETLKVIESGEPFTDEVRRRLDRVPRNRAQKYRRLRRRLAAISRPTYRGEAPQVEALAAADSVADSVADVRRALSPDEWAVESLLASGQTFAEVAPLYDLAPGTLKVRANRWRARIRASLAG